MSAIRINVTIKTPPEKVYNAITTQDGLANWWAKQTEAKPEVGFINVFTFGQKYRNEMKITNLIPLKKVEWECVNSVEEWVGTRILFDLQEKEGNTILRFTHSDWKSATDFFASCTYDWSLFIKSLKSLCETGSGSPF